MRIPAVLDTNVLVSALLSSKGAPAVIWNLTLDGEIQLFITRKIFHEYKEVLAREKFKIPPDEQRLILRFIEDFALCLEVTPSSIKMIDEDDREFLDAADQSDALLITGNQKHFPRRDYILSPSEFLQLLERLVDERE